MKSSVDRRVARTKAAVIAAFNDLVLRRRGAIRASEIIEHANIGRSTFYDHFTSAEEVHIEALARPYAALADAVVGNGGESRLTGLLEHLWENRGRARETYDDPRLRERTLRMLSDLVAARLAAQHNHFKVPLALLAPLLAHAAHAPIRAWIAGAAACDANALALAICSASRATMESLRVGQD